MKKFILFDNDGVLVETEKWYFESNVKALKEIGLNLDFDVYQDIMTRGASAWEIAFNAGIPTNIIDTQRERRDCFYQEFLQTKDITIPNVKKVLSNLSKKYKMAIITTSRRVDFELIHKNRGIVDFMDFVLCVEDYSFAKPHPEPYLKGLLSFNAKSQEAIVVEDSQRGLISAYNANIDCVVVKNDFTSSQDFSKAKHFIHKLEDLENLL